MRALAISLMLAIVLPVASAQSRQESQESQEFVQSTEALALQPRSAAYGRFVDLYIISAPHPDKGIQGFIDQARKGDKDAFAFVSFMIWQGHAGFRSNQLNAKLALTSALKDGSAVAAYFIGETFVQAATQSDAERAERYADSLHWYGMAAGMGEPRAHDRAMAIIKTLAPTNQEHRRVFMGLYNTGLQQGVQAKRQAAR